MSNLVKTTAIAHKRFLAYQMQEALDQKLGNEQMQVKGFNVNIDRIGVIEIGAIAKSILTKIPLGIQLSKPEGLFTIEASGAVMLDIRMDIDILPDFTLSTDTAIQDYIWLEDPSIKVGILQIPVERIMDTVIKRKEQEIAEQLDKAISANFDLRALIARQLNQLAYGIPLPKDLTAAGHMKSIQISHIKEEGDKIYLHILPEIDLFVKSKKEHHFAGIANMPTVQWIFDMPKAANSQEILLEMSYTYIGQQFVERIDGIMIGGKSLKVEDVTCEGIDDSIMLNIVVNEPVAARVIVKGKPFYEHEAGTIDLKDLDISVKTDNILYKLSAPLLNKVIENRLEDMMPIELEGMINDVWKEQRNQLPSNELVQYSIDIDRIDIDHIEFKEDRLQALIRLKQPEVEVYFAV